MNRRLGVCEIVAVVLVLFSGTGVARAQGLPAVAPQTPPEPQPSQPPEPAYPPPEQDRGDAKATPTKLPRFSVPIRAAVALQGTGVVDDSCDGDCAGIPSGRTDFENHVALGLSVDFMGTVGRMVRMGLGFFYVAPYAVDLDAVDDRYEVGSDLSMDFVFELTRDSRPACGSSRGFRPA